MLLNLRGIPVFFDRITEFLSWFTWNVEILLTSKFLH